MNKPSFFLDSGAYSAMSKGAEINIDEYIQFIKDNEEYIDMYANLDSIGSAEKTLENQKYMESKGLNPLPCFHYGEDFKYLKHYVENYEYIALGGMVPISNNKLYPWLDEVFKFYICDNDGLPKIKIHGFGLTSVDLMIRYPWYSVDSTSWIMTSRFGSIFMPPLKGDSYDYNKTPLKIQISEVSVKAGHYFHMSKNKQKEVDKYLAKYGFKAGSSKTNEKGELEVVEAGAINTYEIRDKMNIFYFKELERHLKWPRKFKMDDTQIRTLF